MSADPASSAALYRRVTGVDIRTLPLRPEEAFVLSRVDGQSDAAAIAVATGMPPARVAQHLHRLEELGTVRRTAAPTPTQTQRSASRAPPSPSQAPQTPSQFPRSPSQAPRSPSLAPPSPSQFPRSPSQAPRSPSQVPRAAATPARPSSPVPHSPASGARAPATPAPASDRDHPEIDESLSLSIELQARILDLSARLSDLDHFELLRVPREADRAAVKRAYFSMIGTFHPDTYFGKRLGAFTKRMEKIFQRLTEAHDVLSNPKAREEYEVYLTALRRTRGLDPSSHPPASVEDMERLLLQAEQAAKQASPPSPPPAPAPSPRASPTGARPALKPPPLPPATRSPSQRPVQLVDDPVARRQALARKFGRTNRDSSPPPAPEPEKKEARVARHSAAVRELHQRYQHRRTAIRDQRIERFAKAAEVAIASGNNVSALNTLKIARTLSGGDLAVVARIEELEKQIGSTVADSYLQRGRYEESNGHYAEAARSYTRAARGQPNAELLRSAAECYLKAGVELRLAGDLAKEAVQMAPDRVDSRLTLAKIYEAAGMPQSAVRELEHALKLTPDSERIKQWLKRLQRGGV